MNSFNPSNFFAKSAPSSPASLSSMISGGAGGGSNTWVILLAVVLFGVLGFFLYYYLFPSQKSTTYHANKEHAIGDGEGGAGNTAELMFFFANWCPHCKTAKPIWNDLKSEYENKTINGYKVVFTDVDCSEESQEVERMMNKYSVEGYPTIKLLKDGQVIEYDAKPTRETLVQFLNTVL